MVSSMEKKINLTSKQQEAISEIDHNLQIIACAGSGKTEVITRRIANILQSKQDIKPENIVAFTFTNKAAESLENRIVRALGSELSANIKTMYIGTIHSFCYNLLTKYTKQFDNFKILDSVKSHLFVKRNFKECGMSDLNLEPYSFNINLFLQCIEKMIDDYENSDNWSQEQRDVLNKYTNFLYSNNYIDFSLIIFETVKQIESNPEVGKYLSTLKYLVVDEYQDVNDLQEKLISHIANYGTNICVVGDDDQTIYQFRGSNANNMISFSKRYTDVHQVYLDKNFRCAKGIVDVANNVIKNNKRRISKKMISTVNESNGNIKAERCFDEIDEFNRIAKKIIELHNSGIHYKEIAILVRKGKFINSIANILDDANIPYETDSTEHFFSGNYFNRFVITLQILTDIDKAKLYECWKDVAERTNFNIGFKFLRSCARGGNLPLSKIIRDFCDKIAFLDEIANDIETRHIDLDGISKILDDYDEIYGDWQLSARINGVLKFLGTDAINEYKYYNFKPKDPNADNVQIMTIHKAKGLEFNTVFIPRLNEREFPTLGLFGKRYYHVLGGVFKKSKTKYQSSLEDERKLFYVAVTRAKQNLYMTYSLAAKSISCFLDEASSSAYLDINNNDLTYNLKDVKYDFTKSDGVCCKPNSKNSNLEQKLDKEQLEYTEVVKYAQNQLIDYYNTGAQFYPTMHTMLSDIREWSPEKIMNEASNLELI